MVEVLDEQKFSDGRSIEKDMTLDQSQVAEDAQLTKAQARRLVLKTDLVVMPLIVLSMTLAFLDKVYHLFVPSV